MDRQQKEAQVAEIATKLTDSQAVFAIDYRGITVTQAAELRTQLREAGASFNVVKNRLAKRAADESKTEGLETLLVGPTALTFVQGDPVVAAKALSKLGSEWELLEFKGGLMEGAPLDPDSFKQIARLPGLDVLHGQLVGLAASPLTGIVRGLGALVSGLALQLGQIAEQGLVGKDSPEPAPEPEAEKAEEPEAEKAEEPEAEQAEEPEAEQAEDDKQAEEPAADAGKAEAEAPEADEAAGDDGEDADTTDADTTDTDDGAADGDAGEETS